MDLSALALSTGVVALAEMGDKTQLLSLMLAARYPKQALVIISGIFVATIANHACAAFLGYWLTSFVNPDLLKWILGLSFLGIGLWLLVPDHVNDAVGSKVADRALQVFLLTGGLFFVAEMGDKTQMSPQFGLGRHLPSAYRLSWYMLLLPSPSLLLVLQLLSGLRAKMASGA
jgi:putative Ca2+/H+ antiporter (TMEM165/GDT1 family)